MSVKLLSVLLLTSVTSDQFNVKNNDIPVIKIVSKSCSTSGKCNDTKDRWNKSINPDVAKRTNINSNNTLYYFCGVRDDPVYPNSTVKSKRYVLQGSKWKKGLLTWAVVKPSNNSDYEYFVRSDFIKATELWSRATANLRFKEVHPKSEYIDIKIGFFELKHTDNFPFDGKGGTLGHAFYPNSRFAGDIHLDDAEPFADHSEADPSQTKLSFYMVVAHELGHSLGLKHSNKGSSLMAPFYQLFKKDFELPLDDQLAIQTLYGNPLYDAPKRKTTKKITTPASSSTRQYTTPKPVIPHRTKSWTTPQRTPWTTPKRRPWTTPKHPAWTTPRSRTTPRKMYPPTRTTTPSNTFPKDVESDFCTGHFDAGVQYRGETFLFAKDYVWRLMDYDRSITRVKLSTLFPELTNSGITHVDASCKYGHDDGFLVFSGNRVIVYSPPQIQKEYKLYELGITGINKLNAAWVWGHNGHTYISSGNLYWRLNEELIVQVDYPRDAAVWQGIPMENVTAALTRRGQTYFFAGNMFWHYNNLEMRAYEPGVMTAPFWLQCDTEEIT